MEARWRRQQVVHKIVLAKKWQIDLTVLKARMNGEELTVGDVMHEEEYLEDEEEEEERKRKKQTRKNSRKKTKTKP